MAFLENIKHEVRNHSPSLVFSEGDDLRILQAAEIILQDKLAKSVTLVGDSKKIEEIANAHNISLSGVSIISPQNKELADRLAGRLVELQSEKFDMATAQEAVQNRIMLGALYHETGQADIHISGAVETSADVIRTYYLVYKSNRREGVATSFFVMLKEAGVHDSANTEEKIYFFSDCAFNILPSPKFISKIAYQIGNIAQDIFGQKAKVVLLSYSTKGSGADDPVDAVVEAGQALEKLKPGFTFDYEFQADAALSARVAARKAPQSPVQGDANVLIFPSLEAGNIAYKMAEQFGGLRALGPVMVGLGKDASDLSRGAQTMDIVDTYAVTAYYSIKKKLNS